MRSVFGKLNTRRGVSVLIAVLVFLLASLTGVAILSMASSNVGRHTHEREDQQAYLAVSSAVSLVRGELQSFSVTSQFSYDEVGKELKAEETTPSGSALFAGMSALLQNCERSLEAFVMENYLEKDAGTVSSSSVAFTLRVGDGEASDRLGAVSVNLSIGSEQSLVFEFSREDDTRYRTSMTVRPADADTTVSETEGVTWYSKVFRWDTERARIERVGG